MLVLDGVRAGYGRTQVLRGIDLVVPDGSVVALLGANGAGKTTLLRTAAGLLPATEGRILLDGENLTTTSPNRRVKHGLCLIPEGRGVFPSLTVADNITIQSVRGREAEAVERATAAFPRLGQRLRQLAGTMSGGEQQMLALARAYVQSPRVVLLDEVSMGLAPKVVDEIFEFLGRLAAEGASLLLVEQYVTRALEIANYVYLLNKGDVAFAGEPCELDADEVFASYAGADI
jgi:branched-chain amino acid transport system ATP-binding protein